MCTPEFHYLAVCNAENGHSRKRYLHVHVVRKGSCAPRNVRILGSIPGSSSNRQRGCSVAITGKAQKQGRVEADPVRKEEPYSSLPQPKYITINEYKSKYNYPASVKSGILRERRS